MLVYVQFVGDFGEVEVWFVLVFFFDKQSVDVLEDGFVVGMVCFFYYGFDIKCGQGVFEIIMLVCVYKYGSYQGCD